MNMIDISLMTRYVVAEDIVDTDGKVHFHRGEVVGTQLDTDYRGNTTLFVWCEAEDRFIELPYDFCYSSLRRPTAEEKVSLEAEDKQRKDEKEKEYRQWQAEKASFLKSIEGKKISDLTIAEYRQAKEYDLLP